jgi:hypothetical protein
MIVQIPMENSVGKSKDCGSVGPSTTHQSGSTPHSGRVGNLMAKSDLVTLKSLDTINYTQHPSAKATGHTRHP